MKRLFFLLLLTLICMHAQTVHAVNFDEIQNQIDAPQPQITIPGVSFSSGQDVQQNTFVGIDGNTYLSIPYLGEYISAVYRYSIIVIGILAVIMIIFAGFQIATSGGESDRVQAGRTRIAQAVTGLLLAVGSYVLLYTINPNLISFNSLPLFYVPRQAEDLPEEDTVDYSSIPQNGSFSIVEPQPATQPATTPQQAPAASPPPKPAVAIRIIPPSWDATTFDCNKAADYIAMAKPPGVADPSALETYTCPVGVQGTITSIPQMHKPICNVGKILNLAGYSMVIKDSYRTFKEQVQLWCGRGATEYPKVANRKKFFAVPGFSSHGHGNAVDAHLADKNKKRLYENVTGSTQCKEDPALVKFIADAFLDSDPNFHRLQSEVWHFEYGRSGNKNVGNYRGLPVSCGIAT